VNVDAAIERFRDVEEAHLLLPHVEMLQELGIALKDAFVLAASEVSVWRCRQLLEHGCPARLLAEILT
jgi:hypothetical protein